MGEHIKILEMARNLIRLSGLIPDEEIPMTFIGLRPGEKLCEELGGVEETVQPSGVEQICQVQVGHLPKTTWLRQTIATLERWAVEGASKEGLDHLGALVPTYPPTPAADAPA